MRVAALWKQMSSHSRASFAALRALGAEVMLVHRDPTPDAPYVNDEVNPRLPGGSWSDAPDEGDLAAKISAFAPDVLLVCSWDVGAYRRLARSWRGRTLRVLFMDNPWRGTAKQWGGRLVSPAVIRPAYDVAFVPSERQGEFARRLGFKDDSILWGSYTCDHETFSAVSHVGRRDPPQRFVYVGRLVPEKGVDVLGDAYRQYRRSVSDPWPLEVCGAGPLGASLAGIPDVSLRGFVQPSDLPGVFERAGCLVLPSRFEPWGVVVHEAASAGLAIVCSTECGASSRLVVDGYNGAVVPAGNIGALAIALGRVANGSTDLSLMSRRSTELGAQFTPARWATYLLERSRELRERMGLAEQASTHHR